MKRFHVVVSFLLITLSCSLAWAQRSATPEDMAKLQTDLANLEADLGSVGKDRLSTRQSERLESIHDNVIYLKVKMQKHQEAGGEGTGVTLDEVQSLRFEIADLRNDLHGILSKAGAPTSLTIPVGTEIALRLDDSLTSATAQAGDSFTATSVEPVVVADRVALEAGTPFTGRVELVNRTEGRTDRKAALVLAFGSLEDKGKTYSIDATVIKASEKLETGLGSEKTKMAVGAGLGTILGAVLGGEKGALIGAVAGGSGAILATEGKEVELPRGTILYVRVDREVVLPVN
jgi:hypothetical protein